MTRYPTRSKAHPWKKQPFSAKAKKRIARVTVERVNRGTK